MPYNGKEPSVKLIRKTTGYFALAQSNHLITGVISPKAVGIKNTEAAEITNTKVVTLIDSLW
jgi:hypothetical protein